MQGAVPKLWPSILCKSLYTSVCRSSTKTDCKYLHKIWNNFCRVPSDCHTWGYTVISSNSTPSYLLSCNQCYLSVCLDIQLPWSVISHKYVGLKIDTEVEYWLGCVLLTAVRLECPFWHHSCFTNSLILQPPNPEICVKNPWPIYLPPPSQIHFKGDFKKSNAIPDKPLHSLNLLCTSQLSTSFYSLQHSSKNAKYLLAFPWFEASVSLHNTSKLRANVTIGRGWLTDHVLLRGPSYLAYAPVIAFA